jgi:hypothetical protein
VAGACVGLAVRDAAMIGNGAPSRLRRLPASLLYLEFGAAVLAALFTAPRLRGKSSGSRMRDSLCRFRQVSTAAFFGLHTIRQFIYLQPDQGRRAGPWDQGHLDETV